MRADNRGEGGVIALVALIRPQSAAGNRVQTGLVLLGMIGVALLYGDGTITPAISVLSAVEGLQVATPVFRPTCCRSRSACWWRCSWCSTTAPRGSAASSARSCWLGSP